MSQIFNTGFDRAVNVGLTNAGDSKVQLEESDGSSFDALNGYSKTKLGTDWGRSGSQIANRVSTWGTWEAASPTEAGQLRVKVDLGSGVFGDLLLLTGGDFPQSVDTGTDVTVDPGFLDCVYPGLAEVLLNGLSNTAVDYVLRDGSGTEQARLTPSDSGHVGLSFDASNNDIETTQDLTFSNDGSSSWSVEEIDVVTASGLTVFNDTSVSTSVPAGGSITFTTLRADITL